MLTAAYICVLAGWSVALAWHDFRDHRLPDLLTLPAIPVALTVLAVGRPENLSVGVTAAVILMVAGLAAHRIADLGLGDVKLLAPTALVVASGSNPGESLTLWLVGTAILGGIHAAIHLVITRDRHSDIPFGPSILGAMLVAVLSG